MWRDILPGGRVSASDINNLADWGEQTVTGNVGVTRSAAGLHISANDDARILIRITGAADAGAYPWEEVYRDAVLGTIEVVGDGREGTTDDVPAYELNDTEDVPEGTVVEATLDESGEFLVFEVPGSAITATFIVGTVDGSPYLSGIHSFAFDELDGFVITNPTTGVARVDIAAATEDQAGIVTTGTQTFGGDKYFPDNIGTHDAVITGDMSCATGSAGTFAVDDWLTSSKHTVACPADFGTTVVEWMKFNYSGIAGVTVAEITHGPVISSGAQFLIRTFNPGLGGVLEIGAFLTGRFDISKGDWPDASDPFYSCRGLAGVDITEAGVTYTGGIRTGGTLAIDGGDITGTIDGDTW